MPDLKLICYQRASFDDEDNDENDDDDENDDNDDDGDVVDDTNLKLTCCLSDAYLLFRCLSTYLLIRYLSTYQFIRCLSTYLFIRWSSLGSSSMSPYGVGY